MNLSDLTAAAIVLIAALLTVISGFGFVVLSAPLLSYLYDPLHTVYLSIVLGTSLLGILIVFTDVRRTMHRGVVVRLCLWSLLGLPLGLLIVPYIDKTLFRIVLGVITLGYVLFKLWGRHFRLGNPALSVALAGVLGGAFSTSTGMSALPVIFLAGDLKLNAFEHRATLAGYVFVTGLTSLTAFHLAGTGQSVHFQEMLLLAPALLAGMAAGTLLIKRLSEKQLAVGVLIYLAVNGVIAAIPFEHF